MKYSVTGANGDAGEFFFAYKIASVLKWPCRLFDIDIGIDAQVEVINDDRTSTGKFVAFQVKATSAEESNCRYVSERQLAYWRELDLPVFVVLVDLAKEEMYLHRVRSDKTYPRTRKGAVRVDFDLFTDLFDERSGAAIASAADEAALAHVRRHLAEVWEGVEEIRASIARTDEGGNALELIETMNGRTNLRQRMARAEAVSNALHVGTDECANASSNLEEALEELRDHMQNWGMHNDWDDDGEIARFLSEGR